MDLNVSGVSCMRASPDLAGGLHVVTGRPELP
jgi:hypothetical protein